MTNYLAFTLILLAACLNIFAGIGLLLIYLLATRKA